MSFSKKFDEKGKENPKYIDLLDEDKPLSGQKFVCVSFVSPENILKQRQHFMFEQFLKYFDFSKSVEKFTQFLNFTSYKYNLNFENVMKDFEEFIAAEKESLSKTNISDDYKTYLDKKEESLTDDFNSQNEFQTSVRGLKVRGVYSTQAEAELRCKMLREIDPNHNVYVGPVGLWMPWEPEAYKTGRVEYLETELNQLMNEKNKNEMEAKQEFEKRVLDAKRKAITENIKLAKKTGNTLTQNIDKEGNLVGADNGPNTTENNLKKSSEVTGADIRKELFDKDVVPTNKKM
jgi:hypothetical protein